MKFSTRTMLITSVVVCIYSAVVFGMPTGLGFLILLVAHSIALPIIVVSIMYSNGASRAFWIGAGVGGFLPILTMQWFFLVIFVEVLDDSSFDLSLLRGDPIGRYSRLVMYGSAVLHLMILFSGIAGVVTRRVVERRYPPASQPRFD